MLSKFLMTLFLAFSFTCVFSGCKKSHITKPSYTSRMGGIRKWHGSNSFYASGLHYPTPVNDFYYYPDTSFALTIINDTAIQFMTSVFPYDRTDSVRQIYFFGAAYNYYYQIVGTGLAYYYAKDSIVYCHGDVHATSDYWIIKELYYTY